MSQPWFFGVLDKEEAVRILVMRGNLDGCVANCLC